MSVDTERDYTGIRCLRIGERSANSKMKETKDKTMWMWFGKHKKQIVLWSVIILIAVPLIVYGLSEVSLLPVTGGNDWAGFWGGYIGAIIGGLITLFVMKYTIKSENAKSNRQEKIQYFNDVIKISAEFFESVGNLCVKMTRCMVAPSNEKYEQVLEENNKAARTSIILELMLETREDEYAVEECITELNRLSEMIETVLKEFENHAVDIFSSGGTDELDSKLEEIIHETGNIKDTFKKNIKRNLYSV